MGFESWEGEYTAVQLINNNGLICVLTGCFLGVCNNGVTEAAPAEGCCRPDQGPAPLSGDVPSTLCQTQGVCDVKSRCAAGGR